MPIFPTDSFDKSRQLVTDLTKSSVHMFPYAATVEEISHIGITFLDLYIWKSSHSQCSRRLAIAPSLKSTALRTILSSCSGHPDSVHASWMLSYIHRLRKHCSDIVWLRSFKLQVLKRFSEAGVDSTVVNMIDKATTFIHPVKCFSRSVHRVPSSTLWIRLPFHPCWQRHLNAALSRFSRDTNVDELFGKTDIRAAWFLESPTLLASLKRH